MSGSGYADPWEDAIRGPWRDSLLKGAAPCHYGCGQTAYMVEPGSASQPGGPWKAHKTCALGTRDDEIVVMPHPADTTHAAYLPRRELGCGDDTSLRVKDKQCASLGTTPACMLCPNSPNYWRNTYPNTGHGSTDHDAAGNRA